MPSVQKLPKRRLPLLASAIFALAAIAVSCGSSGGGSTPTASAQIQPIAGNSELVVGPNRFTVAFLDSKNQPLLESGNAVHLQFFDPSGALKNDQDAKFVWAIPNVSGFWVANVTFDASGNWRFEAKVTAGGKESTVKAGFTVLDHGVVPAIGDLAPPTDNLTLSSDANMKQVTTDPQPNMAFYQMTVTQALDVHKPFVVVFATPLFCTSFLCGPLLNNVKAVQPDFADKVNFIHIEPYKLDENGHLVQDANGSPVPATPTDQWKLQTEPWVFVVGADGKVAARFEGSASADELRVAIQQVAGT